MKTELRKGLFIELNDAPHLIMDTNDRNTVIVNEAGERKVKQNIELFMYAKNIEKPVGFIKKFLLKTLLIEVEKAIDENPDIGFRIRTNGETVEVSYHLQLNNGEIVELDRKVYEMEMGDEF